MRILLLRPNSIIIATPVPLGLGYVASYLLRRRPDDQLKIIDGRNLRLTPGQMVQEAVRYQPDLVGISAINFEADQVHILSGMLKQALPQAWVVVGGPYASANRGAILEQDPNIDYLLVCEGEQSFYALVEKLESKSDLEGVPGLFFRRDGRVHFTGEPEPISDLDDLPFDWELVNPRSYYQYRASGRNSQNIIKHSFKTLSVITSRGCPFGCIFCHNIFGRKFRKRSAERVVEEISLLRGKYGCEELEIVDDCFNLDLARAKAICRGIIERKLGLHLSLPNGIRGDIVDEEFLDLLKAAGFYRIAFAVESASPRIQQIIHKKIDLDKVQWAITETAARGMFPTGYFIMGFPTETAEDIEQTIRFARQSKLSVASFFYLNPFPGTEVARMAGEEKVLGKLFRDYSTMTVNLSALDDRTLHKLNKRAYREFYLDPVRALRTLKLVPKNFRTFVNMFLVFKLLFQDSVNQ
jgi:radical SAM superfamily enzyme YgiQ (UPF0313 family)